MTDPLEVLRHRQELTDMAAVMTTESGRAVIYRIISSTGLFTDCMRPTDRDTAFALGRREVGLPIFADIHERCPELYASMLTEAQRRQQIETMHSAPSV